MQTPYVIIDLDIVETKFRELSEALHSTELCYAVKANPGKPVIERLAALGASFDVASVPEIDLVLSCGVEPARISFGNTIKKQRDIAYAAQQGITRFTVDTMSELHKVLAEAPQAEVCVRLFHDCEGADWPLSKKFGCGFADAKKILNAAGNAGCTTGISFHVGSQAADPSKHVEAIDACARLLAVARREKLGPCDTLDIGGGFPIDYSQRAPIIHKFCAPIRAALAKLPKRVRVIAEPGRYIAGPAAIGVASVMGRAEREGLWWYYLDDGLYGSYSGQLFDHARYPIETLKRGKRHPSVLAGPTCDSIDVISENILLPELEPGDLIVGRAMGAYTWASASEFNFFLKATVVSVNSNRNDRGSVLTIER